MTISCDREDLVTLVERMEHLVEHMHAQQRQFITDASHELGTPLASLRLQLEEARMHPGQTDLGELIHHALREVDRIQDIVGNLLMLARLDAGTEDAPGQIEMAGFVEGLVGERPHGLPVHLDLEEGLVVGGAAGTLARLLGNLLDNAERHAKSAVRVSVSGEEDEVVVTVDDDGPGIPVLDRERVFDHFTRIDSARSRHQGGTGLGLPIALAIAQAHGGTLIAQESAMGGAQLVLRLPLLQASATDKEAA
ncbi:signal transduction histidine kinase [Nonomuraea fuscirosea]|uniref:histidine kinase n=1 Tax=Nonomuraea fuscirosea TaxID=1291556 RepID=A0A2T0LGS5_9ACTN|nr:HAMP domain-containing sensor histidine kinase [Nonomuraea fuscirosea]PRX41357.1 signal transduction histidine kinase [Nonomuraea fuscirosea]